MIKALLAFIAIISQVIICMLCEYNYGYGYSLVLFVGFIAANIVFVIVYLAEQSK